MEMAKATGTLLNDGDTITNDAVTNTISHGIPETGF